MATVGEVSSLLNEERFLTFLLKKRKKSQQQTVNMPSLQILIFISVKALTPLLSLLSCVSAKHFVVKKKRLAVDNSFCPIYLSLWNHQNVVLHI